MPTNGWKGEHTALKQVRRHQEHGTRYERTRTKMRKQTLEIL